MSVFRDDRDALLARNQALETELQRAQTELAKRPVRELPERVVTIHVLERGEAFILATAVLCAFWHPVFFVLLGILIARQRRARRDVEEELHALHEENRYLTDVIWDRAPRPRDAPAPRNRAA